MANLAEVSRIVRRTALGVAGIALAAYASGDCGANTNTEPPSTPTVTASTPLLEPDPCLPVPTDVKAAPTQIPGLSTTKKIVSQENKFEETYSPNDWKQGGESLMRHGAREFTTRINVTSEPVNPGTTLEDAAKSAVEKTKTLFSNDKAGAKVCPSQDIEFNGYQAIETTIISGEGVFGPATKARSTEYNFLGKNGRIYSVIFSAEFSNPAFYNGEEQKAQKVIETVQPTP